MKKLLQENNNGINKHGKKNQKKKNFPSFNKKTKK